MGKATSQREPIAPFFTKLFSDLAELQQESFTSLREVLLPENEADADAGDETMAKLITFLESSEVVFKSVPPTNQENIEDLKSQ